MDDAYDLIDIRQSCYKSSCQMPDESQYDEKTDSSLTKTAQIIGMPLLGHPGRATSDRERVLAEAMSASMVLPAILSLGMHVRVWSRLLTI